VPFTSAAAAKNAPGAHETMTDAYLASAARTFSALTAFFAPAAPAPAAPEPDTAAKKTRKKKQTAPSK
jgi:hypothetical protein